ncbi:MAG: hypothetical protein OK454_01810 [Thaumarchaeota archaeon]|nr:hypothetical protein [Nitrososphaerota archaeon]
MMQDDEGAKMPMTPEDFEARVELAKTALEVREAPTRKDLQTLPSPPPSVDEALGAANPTEQLSKAELLKIIVSLREENKTLRSISEKWGMCLITLHRLLGDRQRVAMMGVLAAAQAFNIVEAVLKSAEKEAAELMKKKQEEEKAGG